MTRHSSGEHAIEFPEWKKGTKIPKGQKRKHLRSQRLKFEAKKERERELEEDFFLRDKNPHRRIKEPPVKKSNPRPSIETYSGRALVFSVDLEMATKRACEGKERELLRSGASPREIAKTLKNPLEGNVKKWVVDYIRHQLTFVPGFPSYNRFLQSDPDKETYFRIKTEILNQTAQKYPSLAQECERQLSLIDSWVPPSLNGEPENITPFAEPDELAIGG